ncbi:MAG: hypothetical protein QOC77_1792 [Thermoleophilaceae bacterium]|nr:hypothetical protein [Thermoleophilaceae bacterium]
MPRQTLRLLIFLAALALVASGCGTKSSGSGLDSALRFMPKDAAVVVAIDTNPDGDQWQQVDKLLGKFPFGGQVKQQFKTAFNGRSRLNYDTDIKPLLGNDLVFAVTPVPGTQATPLLVAWKVKDEGAAKKLVQKTAQKAPSIEGAEVYRSSGGATFAFKDGTLVFSPTQADLTAALKRGAGSDHLTEQEFDDKLGGLDKKSLVRVVGNARAIYANRLGQSLAQLPLLRSQGDFGATLRAASDGIEFAFENKVVGNVQDKDVPLPTGAQAAPVVRRAGEIGIGLRDPAHVITFYESTFKSAAPAMFKGFAKQKAQAEKALGVNLDRDLVGQLTGNAAISVSLTGDFAVRADLRDPAAVEATLKKAAPGLLKLTKGNVSLTKPKNGKGFYTLGQANGKKVAFGVVGKSFVAASDAARAAQFAGQSPSVVPGARGSLVIASDARALANTIAARQGQGMAAQLVTGALGDLIGWVEYEKTGVIGNLKLQIK